MDSVTFPHTVSRQFFLTANVDVDELPAGVFGNVSFHAMFVSQTGVQSVHPSAIIHSTNRLEWLRIMYGSLPEFPWEVLPEANLVWLDLDGNALTEVPALESSSLEGISLAYNEVTTLQAGWSLPRLNYLVLSES